MSERALEPSPQCRIGRVDHVDIFGNRRSDGELRKAALARQKDETQPVDLRPRAHLIDRGDGGCDGGGAARDVDDGRAALAAGAGRWWRWRDGGLRWE